VLVTCEETNVASARTIESQGGLLEDVRDGKRRYWIDLPPAANAG
jgi:predicted acetyltransferase